MKNQINELSAKGYKMTINRKMIGQEVSRASEAVRKHVQSELKDKICSIVFDICKKRTFAVLGVSAFIKIDGKTIARSLGMIQLTKRHRGPYLANVIEDLLKEYNVFLKQVYSATTDKARNMDNTVRHLNIYANIINNENNDEVEDIISINECDDQFDDSINSESDDEMTMGIENRIELENELNSDDRYVNLIEDMTNELRRRGNFLSLITQVDCCAHKIQLAVNSAIDKSNARSTIFAVREMTKLLRTTVVNIEFRKLAPQCILPPLCVETRWNSDFIMVKI